MHSYAGAWPCLLEYLHYQHHETVSTRGAAQDYNEKVRDCYEGYPRTSALHHLIGLGVYIE
eukprot:1083459-Amphidinium_carterae.1